MGESPPLPALNKARVEVGRTGETCFSHVWQRTTKCSVDRNHSDRENDGSSPKRMVNGRTPPAPRLLPFKIAYRSVHARGAVGCRKAGGIGGRARGAAESASPCIDTGGR